MRLCLLAALYSASVWAQTEPAYPLRPVRLIVPFAPGGSTDTIARSVSRELTKSLGQSVIVENRPGAGGLIGAEATLKLPADGYTIVYATISTLAVIPLAQSKPSYDPLRDFAPVTLLATLPYVIAAHPSLPARSASDLIKLARAQPRAVSYASAGYATGSHLTAEYFSSVAGIKLVHVPYKGDAPGTIDLMAGQIPIAFYPPVVVVPHVKSGRLKALAVTSLERSHALPDTVTVAESGYPGFESASWHGIAVRAGTPRGVIRRLHQDITSILRNTDVRSHIESSGSRVVGNTPEEFEGHIRAEINKWKRVIASAAIKID